MRILIWKTRSPEMALCIAIVSGKLCAELVPKPTATTPLMATAINPKVKDTEQMDEGAAKVKADGEAQAKAYNKFEWCDDEAKNTNFEKKTAQPLMASATNAMANDIESMDGCTANDIAEGEALAKAYEYQYDWQNPNWPGWKTDEKTHWQGKVVHHVNSSRPTKVYAVDPQTQKIRVWCPDTNGWEWRHIRKFSVTSRL